MQSTQERHLPVTGAYNIRDLGGYHTPSGPTLFRRLIRADGLSRLDADGMQRLIDEGLGTVIDLRHAGELETHPNPFAAHPSVAYHNISLFEQLAPAEAIVGDILQDLYIRALAERGAAITAVLSAISAAPAGVVLFHCTAGKDRTGIIAALMLSLAGVATAEIVEDYARTEQMIAPLIDDLLNSAGERGADVAVIKRLLGSKPETMEATLAHIASEHGTVEAYLGSIGLGPETIARLKSRLLGEQ
jgi:protein-tyrosine phosphatase